MLLAMSLSLGLDLPLELLCYAISHDRVIDPESEYFTFQALITELSSDICN